MTMSVWKSRAWLAACICLVVVACGGGGSDRLTVRGGALVDPLGDNLGTRASYKMAPTGDGDVYLIGWDRENIESVICDSDLTCSSVDAPVADPTTLLRVGLVPDGDAGVTQVQLTCSSVDGCDDGSVVLSFQVLAQGSFGDSTSYRPEMFAEPGPGDDPPPDPDMSRLYVRSGGDRLVVAILAHPERSAVIWMDTAEGRVLAEHSIDGNIVGAMVDADGAVTALTVDLDLPAGPIEGGPDDAPPLPTGPIRSVTIDQEGRTAIGDVPGLASPPVNPIAAIDSRFLEVNPASGRVIDLLADREVARLEPLEGAGGGAASCEGAGAAAVVSAHTSNPDSNQADLWLAWDDRGDLVVERLRFDGLVVLAEACAAQDAVFVLTVRQSYGDLESTPATNVELTTLQSP